MSFLLDEYGLKSYVENVVKIAQDVDQIKEYKREMPKVKQMILDGIWDHLVSHVAEKGTTKEKWYALSELFQISSEQRKMFLKEKLRNVRMKKGEGIDPFLNKIQDIWDQLGAIGEEPQTIELVHFSLNSVSKEWEIFIQGIFGRDKLPEVGRDVGWSLKGGDEVSSSKELHQWKK